ncbi:asparagine synthase (glutamine-hydrolyzing) [Parashewanella tropica]|uniref:asparagine synthase (glutamine-hydrolyzing) n=1 Tax=Parashewanella tropica TaxID=2547970 RepID=UPI0010593EFD|nr:asparagine synthase (glutamine-hydrolyzing) [Parashewanella tropica]
MCGFSGFINLSPVKQSYSNLLNSMLIPLNHRGPDSNGIWFDRNIGIALAHSRLSIHDLSESGHQPMISSCGRYVIAFNGEIYNYGSLKSKLSALGAKFQGDSDTEVLLKSIEYWGLELALKEFKGMFAFALWDSKEKSLYLVRDRLGEKPLYYGFHNRSLLFGSELKALKGHPDWKGGVDRNALSTYLRFGYVPAPYSIYRDIYKLLPGTFKKFQIHHQELIETECVYWSAKDAAKSGLNNSLTCKVDATSLLHSSLQDSVKLMMDADVPVGAFLSGGVDSSLIVSLMKEQENSVNTFSIGFDEKGYNEAEHANLVAKHLQTNHHELYVSANDALNVIPNLPTIYDEPFADESQIPTYLLSKLTREKVTVSLSGDGGDELFSGYDRYTKGGRLFDFKNKLPICVNKFISNLINARQPESWNSIYNFLSTKGNERLIGKSLYKFSKVLNSDSVFDMHKNIVSACSSPDTLLLRGNEYDTSFENLSLDSSFHQINSINKMMLMDQVSYLPDCILAKVDRASMASSLEVRVPLLNHDIFELSWRIPLSMKIENNRSKSILRDILYKYVPQNLIERPKMGFTIPLSEWLKGPLKEWVEDLLDEQRLQSAGYFDSTQVKKLWSEHLFGIKNNDQILWHILMFQAWLNEQ